MIKKEVKKIEDFKEEIKEKTIRYFIKQKLLEVGAGVGGLAGLIVIPYFVGKLLFYFMGERAICDNSMIASNCKVAPSTFLGYWENGIIPTLGLAVAIFFATIGIINWLKSNWKKANKRATEEVRLREKLEI